MFALCLSLATMIEIAHGPGSAMTAKQGKAGPCVPVLALLFTSKEYGLCSQASLCRHIGHGRVDATIIAQDNSIVKHYCNWEYHSKLWVTFDR